MCVNGKTLGVLWKPPFRVDITSAGKPGSNSLEVQVTNLWPNRLIGDQFLPEGQRVTHTNVRHFTQASPLLESGLLGPVRLLVVEKRSVPWRENTGVGIHELVMNVRRRLCSANRRRAVRSIVPGRFPSRAVFGKTLESALSCCYNTGSEIHFLRSPEMSDCPLRAIVLIHGILGFDQLRVGDVKLGDYFRHVRKTLEEVGNTVLDPPRLSPASSIENLRPRSETISRSARRAAASPSDRP